MSENCVKLFNPLINLINLLLTCLSSLHNNVFWLVKFNGHSSVYTDAITSKASNEHLTILVIDANEKYSFKVSGLYSQIPVLAQFSWKSCIFMVKITIFMAICIYPTVYVRY